MNTSLALPVTDPTQAGAARRAAAEWASGRGWSEEMLGRLALVVTELGRNLAVHATEGGSLVLRVLHLANESGVEILSLDNGPGVANFHQCMRDGYSTAGTPGTGLGAVQRVSQHFAVHSQPGVGTALLSELWGSTRAAKETARWRQGGVSVPVPPELVCGDAWAALSSRPDRMRVLLADGLGHGVFAATAAETAVEVFSENPERELPALLDDIHAALRSTRGAAVAIAEIDATAGELRYIGVGNTVGLILGTETASNLVSSNGTVGGTKHSARLMTYRWPRGASLIMATDGLKSHWQLEKYVGLQERPPALLAGVLYRDYVRGKDDATVLAIREQA